MSHTTTRVKTLSSLALALALLALGAASGKAAGNHLDYTFSENGKLTTGYGRELRDSARAVAIQPDGKLVAVGWTEAGGGGINFAVFRYNADGTLDTSFSSDGKQFTDFGGSEFANAVALQRDGKIVVVGDYNQNGADCRAAVARYHTNGSLDTTFSNDGLLLLGFTANSDRGLAEAVAIESNGKIIVAGKDNIDSVVSNFALARLNSDGSFDTTFSGDGKVTTDVGYGNHRVYGVVLQPGGKIVAGGNGDPADDGPSKFVLVRYNSNGSLDTTFAGNGIVSTDFGGTSERPRGGMKPTFDGKLVLAGESIFQGNYRTALARYNSDGTLDTTFDTDGKVVTELPSVTGANDLAVTLEGDIVVACNASSGIVNAGPLFTLLRYRSDGSLDDTFGSGGKLLTIFGTLAGQAFGVAIQFDGRIVAVGEYGPPHLNGGDFAVARYNPKGIAARSDFDEDGRADFAVFRPSEATWYVLNSSTGLVDSIQWGVASSISVPGDYDGDGETDVAVYRPTSPPGWWHIRRSSDQSLLMMLAGTTGDIPVQGDYDGDSITDSATFRPSTGFWYLHQSSLGNHTYANFGQPTDKLVQADYDGDGLTDVAVFRPATGTWFAWRSTLGFKSIQFGASGDIPVPADYDGDGRADIAVFRPSDATWYINHSLDNSLSTTQWGAATDIPAAADFDADGKADLTAFRPSDGYWYVLQSTDGNLLALPFGQVGDVPVSSAYTPQ